MQRSLTYQTLVRITALLLVMGVSLPSGLHAKALVDFCLLPAEESSGMLPDHSCCPSEQNETVPKSDMTHDCKWSIVCTCHVEQAPLGDQHWTTPGTPDIGTLTASADTVPETHEDSSLQPVKIPPIGSSEPIFLLNSSFLN